MNAKEELLDHIGNRAVIWVRIWFDGWLKKDDIAGPLPSVIGQLDFEYDNGFGCQELFGYIWYDGGTWSERGEYDGAEWWEYKQCPPMEKAGVTP